MQLDPSQNVPVTRLGDPTKTFYNNTHEKNLANAKKLESRTRQPESWEQLGPTPPPFNYNSPGKKIKADEVRAAREKKKTLKNQFKSEQDAKVWEEMGLSVEEGLRGKQEIINIKKTAGINRTNARRDLRAHEKAVEAYEATGASEKARVFKNPLLEENKPTKVIDPKKVVTKSEVPIKAASSSSPPPPPPPAGSSGESKASNTLASNAPVNPVKEEAGLFNAIKKDFGIMKEGAEGMIQGGRMGELRNIESAGSKMIEELGRGSHGMGALKLGGYAMAGTMAVKGAFSLASALNPFSDDKK